MTHIPRMRILLYVPESKELKEDIGNIRSIVERIGGYYNKYCCISLLEDIERGYVEEGKMRTIEISYLPEQRKGLVKDLKQVLTEIMKKGYSAIAMEKPYLRADREKDYMVLLHADGEKKKLYEEKLPYLTEKDKERISKGVLNMIADIYLEKGGISKDFKKIMRERLIKEMGMDEAYLEKTLIFYADNYGEAEYEDEVGFNLSEDLEEASEQILLNNVVKLSIDYHMERGKEATKERSREMEMSR